jgi:hypothetical protein
MSENKIIKSIEEIMVNELGSGSSFVLERNLLELGLSKNNFKKKNLDKLVAQLVKDYDKLLGGHAKLLEEEIKKTVLNNS